MRKILKNRKIPKQGEVREVKRFLFIPKRIGNEVRWLEFVVIKQSYVSFMTAYDLGGVVEFGWKDMAWVPSDPVKDCPIYKSEQGCAHVDGMICDIKSCVEYEKH